MEYRDGTAFRIWAAAQLLPGERIENGLARIRKEFDFGIEKGTLRSKFQKERADELWTSAQLKPGEMIMEGVKRVDEILKNAERKPK